MPAQLSRGTELASTAAPAAAPSASKALAAGKPVLTASTARRHPEAVRAAFASIDLSALVLDSHDRSGPEDSGCGPGQQQLCAALRPAETLSHDRSRQQARHDSVAKRPWAVLGRRACSHQSEPFPGCQSVHARRLKSRPVLVAPAKGAPPTFGCTFREAVGRHAGSILIDQCSPRYFFSPAVTRRSSRFSGGGSGQVA